MGKMILPHFPLFTRGAVTRNGKFRVLGSVATYNTQQFYLYLRNTNVPLALHTSSVYAVGLMAMVLRAEAFFCVIPPEKTAPTLHTWCDLVAYFEFARKQAAFMKDKQQQQQQQQQQPPSKEAKKNNVVNWMHAPIPESAVFSRPLEPDASLQPRRRVVALALSLYAAWWLQHTSGYFRWVYALALEREEEIRQAAARLEDPVKSVTGGANGTNGGGSNKQLPFQPSNKRPLPESVKAHARFFLLLDWGGKPVGQIVRKQMIRTLSDYGIRRELHGFISQHLSDLCVQLDAHFRVCRFLLGTEESTVADTQLAAAFEFILKDDPPKYEILDGSMLYLERWIADVTNDTERYDAVMEEIESGKSRKRFSAGTARGSVLFPYGGRVPNRKAVTSLSDDATTAAAAVNTQLSRQQHDEQQEVQPAASSLASAVASSGKRRRQQQQQLLQEQQQQQQQEEEEEKSRRVNSVPLSPSTSPSQPVPLKQVTSKEDVVPESLNGVLTLIQEVLPWLKAQRETVEERINILLETETPLDATVLPDVPSLGEFAGAKVPLAMKLPRLVPRAWDMDVESPTTNLGDLAGADSEVDIFPQKLPWTKKGEQQNKKNNNVEDESDGESGGGGVLSAFRNAVSSSSSSSSSSSVTSVSASSITQSTGGNSNAPITISCGTSMPHLYMAQFVSRESIKCNFSSTPAPQTKIGHAVPLGDDRLRELQQDLAELSLEEPWAIAPQFAERDDVEYIVFRKQFLDSNDKTGAN